MPVVQGVRLLVFNDFKCRLCTSEIIFPVGQPVESLVTGNDSLEIVDMFCCLGVMISVGGGSEKGSVTRIGSRWKLY